MTGYYYVTMSLEEKQSDATDSIQLLTKGVMAGCCEPDDNLSGTIQGG
jgi:hypothetical protein